jgi:multiple sugar transport system permease protein
MLGFVEDFPREIERSAMLDGCGPARRFFQIVLPLTAPALASAAILTALLSWNEFLMASAVGPNLAKTLPVRMAGFITDKGTQWGDMSAMGTVIVLPMMLFALVTQRWLVRGLTAGAVKG